MVGTMAYWQSMKWDWEVFVVLFGGRLRRTSIPLASSWSKADLPWNSAWHILAACEATILTSLSMMSMVKAV